MPNIEGNIDNIEVQREEKKTFAFSEKSWDVGGGGGAWV